MRLTENRISFGSDDIFGRPRFIKFLKIGSSLAVFAIVSRTTIRLLFHHHLHQQLRQLLRPGNFTFARLSARTLLLRFYKTCIHCEQVAADS